MNQRQEYPLNSSHFRLVRRADDGYWELPGGRVEAGASASAAGSATSLRKPASLSRLPGSPGCTVTLLTCWLTRTGRGFTSSSRCAPWTVVKSNDKKRCLIVALRWVLSTLDYPTKDLDIVGAPDPLIVGPPAQVYEQSERNN